VVESKLVPATRKVWKVRAQRRVSFAWRRPGSWWPWLVWFLWGPFLSFWAHTPVEWFPVEEPQLFYDTINNRVICHPSVAREIKRLIADS
jgi:hypothetical protein